MRLRLRLRFRLRDCRIGTAAFRNAKALKQERKLMIAYCPIFEIVLDTQSKL
jgi:hypothetical protein